MKAENFSLMVTVATMVLIALVHQQLELSSTQAGLAGVSLMCIGQQAVLDSYMCLVHLTTGLVVDDLFGAFAGTAFVEVRPKEAPVPAPAPMPVQRLREYLWRRVSGLRTVLEQSLLIAPAASGSAPNR